MRFMAERRAGPTRLLGEMVQDARYAVRSLGKRPGLALAAVLTLALGIGANVAMFGVANLALFRALPFPESDRLVLGRTLWPNGGVGNTVSAPDYYDVRDGSTSFESMATITPFTVDVTITGGDAQRVPGAWVAPGLLSTLGVAPGLGREFEPAEGEEGAEPAVIISGRLWRTRFGGDPSVIGSTVNIDGVPRTVVGVLPPDFALIVDADVWRPMVRSGDFAGARQFHNWLVVARLAPGVTLAQARAEVDAIMSGLAAAYPETNRDKGMLLTDMQEAVVENFRPTLLMLMGAIVLVLLIASGNVASLLLARGSTRRTEMAMRAALGAPRARLVRQLLTESALLGAAAGALGTLLAVVLQRSLVAATPLTSVGLENIGLQPEVLVFAIGLSMVTVLIFGLAPALSAARVDLAEELKSGSRALAGGRARFRGALVVTQVALSVVLLVGAGLLMRSFARLHGVDPGFDAEGLLVAEIGLPSTEYDRDGHIRFYTDLLARARAIPGVEDAGLINRLPIRDQGGNVAAWDAENPPADASQQRLAYDRTVMPGYFAAMRIPIRYGRDFGGGDTEGAPPVIVINETMARTLFPDQDPLGRRLGVDRGDRAGYYEIVGVVGDVQISGLAGEPPMVMYRPYGQHPLSNMRIAARVAGAPESIVGPLRAALRELDPNIPLAGVTTMGAVLSSSVSFRRTVTAALGLFAAVALVLASLGLYGVLAYHVAQRTHEIGLRMALGARTDDIFKMVLRRGFALVGLGLAIGVVAAAASARLIRQLLFQVQAGDPVTFVAVTLFFSVVALAACFIPARRAWRVDPMVAFRSE